jgi:hypothetical protein
VAMVAAPMEAVYDSPTSAEERRIAAPTGLMVVSALFCGTKCGG